MPRLKEENKEQKRNDILAAAKKVFLQRGYELASIQDIANEVGITRGTMYLYFSGKEEIFEELLRDYNGAVLPDVATLISEHDTIWSVIDSMLAEHEQFLYRMYDHFFPVIFEYNTSTYRNPDRLPQLQARYENVLQSFIALLQVGVDRKEFAPALSLQVIARLWITFIDGLSCDTLHLRNEIVSAAEQIAGFRENLRILLGLKEDK